MADIITAPVEIKTIADTLGANSYDLGTLCQHANINMWAKYKPVNNTAAFYDSQLNSDTKEWKDDSDWWKGSDKHCGISVGCYTEFADFLASIDGDKNGWSYASKNTPYRMSDFLQYNHGAVCPVSLNGTQDETYGYSDNISGLNVNILMSSATNLVLSDIAESRAEDGQNTNFKDCYVGFVFCTLSGTTYSIISEWAWLTGKVKIGDTTVPLMTLPEVKGEDLYSTYLSQVKVYAFPFLTLSYKPHIGSPTSGDIIPAIGNQFYTLPTPALRFTLKKGAEAYIKIYGFSYNSSAKTLTINFTIKAGETYETTFRNVYFAISQGSSSAGFTTDYTKTEASSITISANSSKDYTETVALTSLGWESGSAMNQNIYEYITGPSSATLRLEIYANNGQYYDYRDIK